MTKLFPLLATSAAPLASGVTAGAQTNDVIVGAVTTLVTAIVQFLLQRFAARRS